MEANQWRAPLAVRRELLGEIARVLSGRVSDAELAARVDRGRAATSTVDVTEGGVAVIPLRGLITPRGSLLSLLFGGGGGGLNVFRHRLREAVDSADVSAIVIDVDSPGGYVDLVPETAADVKAAGDTKPVIAVANVDAGSAAYWIASQAKELVVTPSGQVGSIGVYMMHTDFSGMDEQMGITTTLISAGKYKTEGNPYEPLSSSAKKAWQQDVDDLYDMFTAAVAEGRGTTQAIVKAGYGEGRMLLADRAATAGLADRVDTFENVVAGLGAPSAEDPPQDLDNLDEGEDDEFDANAADPAPEANDTGSEPDPDPEEPEAAPEASSPPNGGGGDTQQSAQVAELLLP